MERLYDNVFLADERIYHDTNLLFLGTDYNDEAIVTGVHILYVEQPAQAQDRNDFVADIEHFVVVDGADVFLLYALTFNDVCNRNGVHFFADAHQEALYDCHGERQSDAEFGAFAPFARNTHGAVELVNHCLYNVKTNSAS